MRPIHKQKALLVSIFMVLGSSPASYAQLTTWEEDMSKAKALEDQHEFAQAENAYRQALNNLPKTQSTVLFQSKADPTTNASMNVPRHIVGEPRAQLPPRDPEKVRQTLESLLRVLCAQNKWTSATAIAKVQLIIAEHSEKRKQADIDEAKQAYKRLLEKVKHNERWLEVQPLFQKNKFVGLTRTRVHEILGAPDGAVENDSSGQQRSAFNRSDVFSNFRHSRDEIPVPGHRDLYVMSYLAADPPPARLDGKRGPLLLSSERGPGGAFTLLDIDYVNDLVVRYRLRSIDHIGEWVSNNDAPKWPSDEPI